MKGRLSVIDAISSAAGSESSDHLAHVLPHADKAVPEVLKHGILADHEIIEIVQGLAAKLEKRYTPIVEAINGCDVMVTVGREKVHLSDVAANVRFDVISIAYALGLAVGTRIGGER